MFPELTAAGVRFIQSEDWNDEQRTWLNEYFNNQVVPVLTPLTFDPSRPFPRILNKSLNFIVRLHGRDAFGRRRHRGVRRRRAQQCRGTRRVRSRHRGTTLDRIILAQRTEDICARRCQVHTDSVVGRYVHIALLGEQAGVLVELLHVHPGGTGQPNGQTLGNLAGPAEPPADLTDHEKIAELLDEEAIRQMLDDITDDLQKLVAWKIESLLKEEFSRLIREATEQSASKMSEDIRTHLQLALPDLLARIARLAGRSST